MARSTKASSAKATISAIITQAGAVARLHKSGFAADKLGHTDNENVLAFLIGRAETKLDELLGAVVEQGDLSILDKLPGVASEALDEYAYNLLKHAVEKRCTFRIVDENGESKSISNFYFPVILPAAKHEWRLTESIGELLERAWSNLSGVPTERVVLNPRLLPLTEFAGMSSAEVVAALRGAHLLDRVWADEIECPVDSADDGIAMYVIEFQVTTDIEDLQSHFANAADELHGQDADEDDADDEGQGTREHFFEEMNDYISGALSEVAGAPILVAQSGNVFEALAGAAALNEIIHAGSRITQQLTEKGLLDQEVTFHATLHGHAADGPESGSIDQVRISLTDSSNGLAATHIINVAGIPDQKIAAALIRAMAERFSGRPTFDQQIYHICEDLQAPQFFNGAEWVVPSALPMSQHPQRVLH